MSGFVCTGTGTEFCLKNRGLDKKGPQVRPQVKKKLKPSKSLLRHSSLGILPSTIGIGSGILRDDPSYEGSMLQNSISAQMFFEHFLS
jgi:hypothetical protein